MDQALIIYLTLYTKALQQYEDLVSRPADDSKPALREDVSDTADVDVMEEYCIYNSLIRRRGITK